MRISATIVVAALLLMNASHDLDARDRRVNQIPNGLQFDCQTCHQSFGGSPLNDFGLDVEANFLTPSGAAGNVDWIIELAMLDSDGDGFTNGEELQDPLALWSSGEPRPGEKTLLSNPGFGTSVPDGPGSNVVVALNGFSNLVGHWMEMRLVDVETGMEIWSTARVGVPSDAFAVGLMGAMETRDYFVDFYVDGNGNQQYDAPPVDEAWRIRLDNVEGNSNLDFTYNTNYTDIQWGQIVSVNEGTSFAGVELLANTPNPVQGLTAFNFTLESAHNVRLQVLDARGSLVAAVTNEQFAPGAHRVEWSAAALTPGVYFYRLEAGDAVLVRRMLVVR